MIPVSTTAHNSRLGSAGTTARPGHTVAKTRFDRALDEALLSTPVVVITGPAGSGKTTALRGWAARDAAPTIHWTSTLDVPDSVPAETVLLLDDVAPTESLDSAVSQWVERGLRVVVTGRGEPPVGVQRRLGRREATTFDFDDLRFDLTEVEDLAGPAAAWAPALLEWTSGWPVVCRLVLDSLARLTPVPPPPTAPAEARLALRRHQPGAVDYLRAEVFDPMPPEVTALYARLALVGRFDGELVEAALATPDTDETLRALARFHNVLVGVTEEPTLATLPPIVAELVARIAPVPETEARTVLRRAALWHESHGMWDEAIDLMHRAGPGEAMDQVRRLIRSKAAEPTGSSGQALQAFERLPHAVHADPDTLLALAATLMQNGRSDETVSLLAHVDTNNWPTALVAERQATLAFAHRVLFQHAQAAQAAHRALALAAQMETGDAEAQERQRYLTVRASNQLLDVRLWEGDLDAVRAVEETVQQQVAPGVTPLQAIRFSAAAGLRALDSGALSEAGACARESQREAAFRGIDRTHLVAEAVLVQAGVLAETGPVEAALREAERARHLAADGMFPTTVARAELLLARLLVRSGRTAEARQVLDGVTERIGAPGAGQDPALAARTDAVELEWARATDTQHRAHAVHRRLRGRATDPEAVFRLGSARAALAHALQHDPVWAEDLVAMLADSPEPVDVVLSRLGHAHLLLPVNPRAAAEMLAGALEEAERWGLVATVEQHLGGLGPALVMIRDDAEVQAAVSGRTLRWVRPLAERFSTASESLLSERETAVAVLLPTRLTNKEMAAHLSISTNTMKTHVRHIYEKLGVSRRIEAVEKLTELGVIPRSQHSG